jgi:hypothetical protein
MEPARPSPKKDTIGRNPVSELASQLEEGIGEELVRGAPSRNFQHDTPKANEKIAV